MDRGGRCRGRSRGPGPEGEAGGGGRGEGGGGGARARPPALPTRALRQGRLLRGDAASEGETSTSYAFNHRQHVEMEMPSLMQCKKSRPSLRPITNPPFPLSDHRHDLAVTHEAAAEAVTRVVAAAATLTPAAPEAPAETPT